MKTERKLRYMLERIDNLNEDIEKANEARKERDILRKEISELMKVYIKTVEEVV